MSIAIMAIGIPGAGKTSKLRPLAVRLNVAYINKDELREEILGDATDHSRDKEIWEEANRRALASLAQGTSVLLDGTYVEPWKRRDALSLLHEAGASPIIGVVADVPLEVALAQNRNRDRVVAEEFIISMHGLLAEHPPRLEEGFDALIALDELDALERSLS